jgi:hypothetical protein
MKTLLAINSDQANTLIDLVSDQIRAQRVYLRTTPLNKTNIAALTHFRTLKRLLLAKEREIMRQEENTEQENEDILFACSLRELTAN